MNNDQLLDELESRLACGELERDDILRVIDKAHPATSSNLASKLSTILYYIGGGVVFLGLVFLIGQEWDDLSWIMRIFVTLGFGTAMFAAGVLLSNNEKIGAAGPAFFLISAMLLPLGLFVAYDESDVVFDTMDVQLQIASFLFVVYLAGYLAIRRNILLTCSFIYGTWLYFTFTDYITSGVPVLDEWEFMNYRIFFLGLAYMILGYSFDNTERSPQTGWLYAFGSAGVLGAGLALGDWKPDQNAFWEAVYPGLVFGIIFLSAKLRSKIFLIFGSLALGAYLCKITAEYFSDSLGWAFSLVIIGFLLMGVAYLAVRVNRKYISS